MLCTILVNPTALKTCLHCHVISANKTDTTCMNDVSWNFVYKNLACHSELCPLLFSSWVRNLVLFSRAFLYQSQVMRSIILSDTVFAVTVVWHFPAMYSLPCIPYHVFYSDRVRLREFDFTLLCLFSDL